VKGQNCAALNYCGITDFTVIVNVSGSSLKLICPVAQA